ncbi:MAG: methyltransferase domain-containing protein [Bacilli bacterium]
MICPICKKTMIESKHRVFCDSNHSFDKAKSGYINLLLNSSNSGDNKSMIDSREMIMGLGYYQPLAEEINRILLKYNIKSVLDVGCGEGYYSKFISDVLKINVVGMDISKYACLRASKSTKAVKYIVASMKDIPYEDNFFDAILNNFAPHSEDEFCRVSNNLLIKVIPGTKHMLEVKNFLYNDIIIKDSKIQSFVGFDLIEEVNLTYSKYVNHVLDLVRMTPYYYKTKINEDELMAFETNVTFDFKLLIYKKR